MVSSCPSPQPLRQTARRRPVTISAVLLLPIYFAARPSSAAVVAAAANDITEAVTSPSNVEATRAIDTNLQISAKRQNRREEASRSRGCSDNPDYRNKMGMACDKHETVNCAAFINFRNFDQEDVDDLLLNCPKACRACPEVVVVVDAMEDAEETGEKSKVMEGIEKMEAKQQRPPKACEDNPDFRSKTGMSCDKHETVNCAAFINFRNFDQKDVDDLLRNCPKSCRVACEDVEEAEETGEKPKEMEVIKEVKVIKPRPPKATESEAVEAPPASSTATSISVKEKILGTSARGRGKTVELNHHTSGVKYEEQLSEPSLDLFESLDDAACLPGWDPLCLDDQMYVSKRGFRCEQHTNVDCTGFQRLGFSEGEVYDLVTNCPCSCRIPCGSYLTPSPTVMTSSSPSAMPLNNPSSAPTASPVSDPPTATPSASPVSDPPTVSPISDPPTVAPVTSDPTPSPTTSPSTSEPSNKPSTLPTNTESSEPSAAVSSEQSVTASTAPSLTISANPSAFPTLDPTRAPTFMPSTVPTASLVSDSPTPTPSPADFSLPPVPTQAQKEQETGLDYDTIAVVHRDNSRTQNQKVQKAFSDYYGTGLVIAWEFEQSGLVADGGWSVSDEGMTVVFKVEDSADCVDGGNAQEQSGKANAIIMVIQDTLPLHFAIGGMGEMLDEGFESLTLSLNGVVIASATSKAQGIGCSSGPAQVTYYERGPIYLPSGMHAISLQFTTFDDYNHQNVFYQLSLSRAEQVQEHVTSITPRERRNPGD